MTPQSTSAQQNALQAMEAARNQESDGVWAGMALMHLARRDVKDAVAESAVRGAARLVAQTGEGPEELFGEATVWAEEQVSEWRSEGREAFSATRFTVRDVVVWSPAVAAVFSLLMVASDVLFGRWTLQWTPALILMPLLLGVLVLIGNAVATRTRAARGFGWAVGTTVLVMVPLILLLAFFFTGITWTGPEGTFLWGLLQAGAYGLLAWILCRAWPAREATAHTAAAADTAHAADALAPARADGDRPDAGASEGLDQSDQEWVVQARRALRARGVLTERRIAQHLAEVQAHAREAGTSLREEYGPAEGYAWSVPGDATLGLRREILLRGAGLVLVLGLAVWTALSRGWSWRDGAWACVLWFLLSAWLVLGLVKKVRTMQQAAGPARGSGESTATGRS